MNRRQALNRKRLARYRRLGLMMFWHHKEPSGRAELSPMLRYPLALGDEVMPGVRDIVFMKPKAVNRGSNT